MFDFSNMKTLKEAVPGIMTTDSLMERSDGIYIEKMLMPRSRDILKIYLHAPFIIPKRDIWALEAAIKKQHFKNKDVTVRIIERFHLEDMTAQQAYEAYKDSMFLELKTILLYEYNLFRKSAAHILYAEKSEIYLTAAVCEALCTDIHVRRNYLYPFRSA